MTVTRDGQNETEVASWTIVQQASLLSQSGQSGDHLGKALWLVDRMSLSWEQALSRSSPSVTLRAASFRLCGRVAVTGGGRVTVGSFLPLGREA